MPTLEQLLPMLAAEPGDAFLRYAVAMEYAKQGRFEESLREFRELLRRSPDYVPAYFMGGRTCEQNGDVEGAKVFYREGIVTAKRVGDEHAAGEISGALFAIEYGRRSTRLSEHGRIMKAAGGNFARIADSSRLSGAALSTDTHDWRFGREGS